MKLSIALSALVLASASTQAATKTWLGTGGDNLWSNAANWVGGAVPQSGDTILIPGSGNGGSANVNDLAPGFTVGGLLFEGSGSSAIGTYNTGNDGGSLKLDGNISRNNSGSSSIASQIELLRDVTITVDGARSLALYNSAVSGSFGILKDGTGTLTMRGHSTFTGGVTVNAGVLSSASDGAGIYHFGMGTLTVNNGGTVRMLGARTTVAGLAGSAGGIIENGNADLARRFTVNSSDVAGTTYAGIFQDGGTAQLTLYKEGAGKLTLTGTNTHTGATTVAGGTLLISDGGSLTASAVSVGAAGTFGGNGGTVSSAVTVADGGSMGFALSDKNQTNLTLQSALTLGGNNDLKLTLNTAAFEGDSFTLLLIDGSRTGTFATINGEAFGVDNAFTLNYGGFDYGFQLVYGADSVSAVVTTAIPEPSVGLLLGAASFGAVWLRGRARRRQAVTA